MLARLMFAIVDFAARKGLADASRCQTPPMHLPSSKPGAPAFAVKRTPTGIFDATATCSSRGITPRRESRAKSTWSATTGQSSRSWK